MCKSPLGFAKDIVGHCTIGRRLDDGAELLLVCLEVVVKGGEEALGVDGAHDEAFAHRGTLEAGKHLGEVEDYLGGIVADNNEVAVGSLGHVGVDVELEVLLLFFLICHICDCFSLIT